MKKTAKPIKINHLVFLSFAFIFLVITNANSQTVHYDSINKQKFVLVNVQKTYERIADKGYESVEIYESLGNYYYENKNFLKSKLYFDRLFDKYSLSQISSKSKERYQLIRKQFY
ncbi:hypothetical protein [Flavobacterium granuli]|uniref:Tetratricopeptide repeat-containing protein n=1 Tax=Flavobacterium granuli TaxID=280093 RepID=A0ABU1S6F3_9FLAO|nr:hypothetical protein [Flavobacterium granuli]MDR6846507.1 hypothetical protein [Flavobacterium granuli]